MDSRFIIKIIEDRYKARALMNKLKKIDKSLDVEADPYQRMILTSEREEVIRVLKKIL